MKTIVFSYALSAWRSPALLTLAWVGFASLGPVLRTEAQTARVAASTGVPRNKVTATVAVGEFPNCIALSPDSQIAYVSNFDSNTVSVLYVANYPAVEATITISNYVNFLALSLDGTTLYVSEEPQESGPGLVEVYNVTIPASPTLTTTLTAGYYPQCMTVSPDGTRLYVANGNGGLAVVGQGVALRKNLETQPSPGAVYVFDTATNTLSNIIVTNGSPFQVLFTNRGNQIDVLNETGPGFIQFIDPLTGIVASSTGAGGRIFRPAGMIALTSVLFPVGAPLYVANGEDYVTVCNPSNGAATKTILGVGSVFDATPFGQPALTQDGKYLYVPYSGGRGIAADATADAMLGPSNNQVVMIDVRTGKIVGSPITVGYDPVWAQVSPDGETLYVCNSSDNTVSVIDIRPN